MADRNPPAVRPQLSTDSLRAVVDGLSDALALVECAEHAFDAAEAPGAELATLRAGIVGLRAAHSELDLMLAGRGGSEP